MKNRALNIFKYIKETAFLEAVFTFLILFSVLFLIKPMHASAGEYNFPYEVNSSSFSGIGPIKSILMNPNEGNYSYDPFEKAGFMIFGFYSQQYNRIQFYCVVPRSDYRIDLYPDLSESQYNFYNHYSNSLKFRFRQCYIESVYFNLSTNTYSYGGYQTVGDFYSDFDLFGNENNYYDFNGVRVGPEFSHMLPVYINGDIMINNLLYISAPQTPAPPLGGVLSMGDLNFQGHSDGFTNDMFDAIANASAPIFGTNYHSLYSLEDIANAPLADRANMLLENIFNIIRNLGVLLNKILLSILWFFDDILVWIRNFWDNLTLIFTTAVNLIVGTITGNDDPDIDFQTWISRALYSFFEDIESPFSHLFDVFDELYNFGKENNEFSIVTFIRRIFIPDDFGIDFIWNRFRREMDNVTGLPAQFINIYYQCFNNISEGVVPSFYVAQISIAGFTIPATQISLDFLIPMLPTIRAFIAVWAWLSFIVYFCRALPTILQGAGFIEVDVEPEHRKIGF